MNTTACIENIDIVDEGVEDSKYICRVHGGDIYIDHDFWDNDNAETPVCDKVN